MTPTEAKNTKGISKMKWDSDPLKYEKYLLFDGIIKFAKTYEGKEFGNISIRDLNEFVDEFFEKDSEISRLQNETDIGK